MHLCAKWPNQQFWDQGCTMDRCGFSFSNLGATQLSNLSLFAIINIALVIIQPHLICCKHFEKSCLDPWQAPGGSWRSKMNFFKPAFFSSESAQKTSPKCRKAFRKQNKCQTTACASFAKWALKGPKMTLLAAFVRFCKICSNVSCCGYIGLIQLCKHQKRLKRPIACICEPNGQLSSFGTKGVRWMGVNSASTAQAQRSCLI